MVDSRQTSGLPAVIVGRNSVDGVQIYCGSWKEAAEIGRIGFCMPVHPNITAGEATPTAWLTLPAIYASEIYADFTSCGIAIGC